MLQLTDRSADALLLIFFSENIDLCVSSPETWSEAQLQLVNKMTRFTLNRGGAPVSSGDTLPGRHAAFQYHSSWEDLKDEYRKGGGLLHQ